MTSKSLEYYMGLPYSIELIPDDDGFWFGRIPLLKGCMTNGNSREDAVMMRGMHSDCGWKLFLS
jgi:antitoxin HicB